MLPGTYRCDILVRDEAYFYCGVEKLISYTGDYTQNISFPLGGIGTGSICLAGNGALVDWEINNRPGRESINPFSGFAIKAEDDARVIDWRFLQGDTARDFMGGLHIGNHSWGYGHGPNRGTLAGGRHFEHTVFSAEFPFAHISYSDKRFPGDVKLTAFNPFIPSNDADSSIPAAMFEFSVTNTSDVPITYTIALSAGNPFETLGLNDFSAEDGVSALTLHSGCADAASCAYGELALATDCECAAHQDYWYRSGWFDDMTMFMNDFGAFGPIKPREYASPSDKKPDICTLTASVKVEPGDARKVRFIISWFRPNYKKYWGNRIAKGDAPDWHNYYAKLFSGAVDCARYCFKEWDRLLGQSQLFADALASSTLDRAVIDAIQGNLCILKSTTCLRLTDGDFYAWEGVNRDAGSCEGTCQHVWNYAYALPFLFPKLERGVRENEIKYSLENSGLMHFRMMLPLGADKQAFRACVDGQMGTVMKCYREWKLSGDNEWLKSIWPGIKSCIEYAWSGENEDKWDAERTGVITGRQHHTLDVELFGANSWLTGFYHGALLAGAQIAQAVGDIDAAKEYAELYQRGHELLERETFNGQHYVQAIDLADKELLRRFSAGSDGEAVNEYWSEENGEIKYQIGDGCEIDQVVADWHAGLIGLGNIFEPDHRKKALKSIYKLNFKNMRDLNNPCRIFACNGESGTTICAWDENVKKPAIPIPYSEEVMTGFEYAYAGSLLQCGMENEALTVVRAIRDRYDGKKRNPFSEIECGASYARAMASYALLLTYSGFRFDMTRGMIGFKPMHDGRYFWSIDGAWGTVETSTECVRLNVLYGLVKLRRFEHALGSAAAVKVNDTAIAFNCDGDAVVADMALTAGDLLTVCAK